MKREDMSEDLINWLDWIQTRIPQLKRSDRELWLVQALEGYKATKPKTKKKSLDIEARKLIGSPKGSKAQIL